MTKKLLFLLSCFICSCTQNQLILDAFNDGESLMIRNDDAIADFEAIMAGVASPENEYTAISENARFFNSQDVLNSYQFTQPVIGVCRSGDKEYYYHIEKDIKGRFFTDLNEGVTDYLISREKYNQIMEYISLHTPVPAEYEEGEISDEE